MRILLAYDSSSGAAEAANLVSRLALPPSSVVRVVSVIEPFIVNPTPWTGGVASYSPEILAQVQAYHEDEIADVIQRLSEPDRTVEGTVLHGRPASVIVEEAREFAADLVVVGSRGRGSIAALVLGSISSEVVDHAPCPVLVARRSGLSRVVLATDGSPTAAAAEALLARWPVFAGLPIRVVSVADVPPPWQTGIAPTMYLQVVDAYAQDLDRAKAEHERIAAESASRLGSAGRDATAEVRCGDAATEILDVVGEWSADLVVLGSRGRTGMTRLLLGSVARNLVHSSSASILVVREATTT